MRRWTVTIVFPEKGCRYEVEHVFRGEASSMPQAIKLGIQDAKRKYGRRFRIAAFEVYRIIVTPGLSPERVAAPEGGA
jgi:hypothetical protein